MARAARYGNIQPSEYGAMEYERGLELARRVTKLYVEDFQNEAELHIELTKHVVKASGARIL